MGHPALGVINIVNWAPRFWRRATERQPVTVRDLDVRKHKLWLGKSQKTEMPGRGPLDWRRFALHCTAIYEEEDDDDGGGGK